VKEKSNMEKLLIAVRGPANSGKTATIVRVYKIIEKKYKPNVLSVTPPFWGKEIRAILTIEKIKIGIVSLGDPSNKPRKNLEYFLQYFSRQDCQIIICACRTKGSTYDAVDHMKQKYRVNWHDKIGVQTDAAQRTANQKMAQQIVNEVKSVIRS
jgi:hypothetical protein